MLIWMIICKWQIFYCHVSLPEGNDQLSSTMQTPELQGNLKQLSTGAWPAHQKCVLDQGGKWKMNENHPQESQEHTLW